MLEVVGKKRFSKLDLSRNQNLESEEEEEDQDHAKWPNKGYRLVSSSANLASKQLSDSRRRREEMQEGFHKTSSRLKLKATKGEIVEAHGGRILRSTGRKDRHSKVCTAKGPRDRRVRLSATTAIQFYDVQDRLRCDRPSEAIDWLMKEAKAAIEALDDQQAEQELTEQNRGEFSKSGYGSQSQQHLNEILPHESRSQNSMLLQHHSGAISSSEPALFTASTLLNFETSPTNWSCPQAMEIGHFHRMLAWNSNGYGPQAMGICQDQLFSQGGTLQSSYSPSFTAPTNLPLSDLNYDQMAAGISPSPATGNLLLAGEGFSGFSVSPRIQGGEEKHIPVPNKHTCLLYFQDY